MTTVTNISYSLTTLWVNFTCIVPTGARESQVGCTYYVDKFSIDQYFSNVLRYADWSVEPDTHLTSLDNCSKVIYCLKSLPKTVNGLRSAVHEYTSLKLSVITNIFGQLDDSKLIDRSE